MLFIKLETHLHCADGVQLVGIPVRHMWLLTFPVNYILLMAHWYIAKVPLVITDWRGIWAGCHWVLDRVCSNIISPAGTQIELYSPSVRCIDIDAILETCGLILAFYEILGCTTFQRRWGLRCRDSLQMMLLDISFLHFWVVSKNNYIFHSIHTKTKQN